MGCAMSCCMERKVSQASTAGKKLGSSVRGSRVPHFSTPSTKSAEFYRRHVLLPEMREIRILVLHPGLQGTAIEISVYRLDLDDSDRWRYAALSYTWGDPTITKQILVEGESFNVTTNLFDALQHVRSTEEAITIWVDAICINQGDNAEKSGQVALMDEIYKQCEKVYIWLGCPADPRSVKSSPFAIVEHFRDDKHFFELPGYRRDQHTGLWICDWDNSDFKDLWASHYPAATSSWWTRAWTAQETILPSQVVVMYGNWNIPWSALVTCVANRARHLNDYGDTCCGQAYQAVGRDRIFPFSQMLGFVTILEHLRQRTGYIKTFCDVSRVFANRQCKDPRDKIYSLLSFIPPRQRARLRPDYSKPVADVYINAFANMLEEADMSPFCLLGEGFNSTGLDLPSWVRDFSKVVDVTSQIRRAFEAYPLFNACGGRSGKVNIVNPNHLQMKGIKVDKVKAKGRVVGAYSADGQHLKKVLDDWCRTCWESGIGVTDDGRDEAFARVLCGEVIDGRERGKGQWRLLTEDDAALPTDAEWRDYLTGNSRVLGRKYRIGVQTASDGRVVYTTDYGRIGLSFPEVEVDDEIWIVDGCKVPFILRQAGDAGFHQLIGDTYLQGVMHGECTKDTAISGAITLV